MEGDDLEVAAFETGQKVIFNQGTGSAGNLVDGQEYWVIVDSTDPEQIRIQIAALLADLPDIESGGLEDSDVLDAALSPLADSVRTEAASN